MFGRRKREETEELLAAARERLEASAEQGAVLVDAITALNATIAAESERNQRLEAASEAAVRALQHALSNQATDMSGALEHVASMYAALAERIDGDRIERKALADALQLMARPGAPALTEPARPRVLGGSVFASPPGDGTEIVNGDGDDRVPDMSFRVGAAVSCRFGDQWIDGVEVVEVVGNATMPAYRLRRRQDGYVLPPLFGARDLRLGARPSPTDTAEAEARGRWARS